MGWVVLPAHSDSEQTEQHLRAHWWQHGPTSGIYALPLNPQESVTIGKHNSLKIRFHRQHSLSDWWRRQEPPAFDGRYQSFEEQCLSCSHLHHNVFQTLHLHGTDNRWTSSPQLLPMQLNALPTTFLILHSSTPFRFSPENPIPQHIRWQSWHIGL